MSDHDEVGYTKPPKHGRFQKGQSGNPSGRPKGTKNLKTDLIEELSERIVISEAGRQIKISKQRAFVKRLMAEALSGKIRSATLLINMMLRVLEPAPPEEIEADLSAEDAAILEAYVKRQTPPAGKGGGS